MSMSLFFFTYPSLKTLRETGNKNKVSLLQFIIFSTIYLYEGKSFDAGKNRQVHMPDRMYGIDKCSEF